MLRSADAITILVPVDQAFVDPDALFLPENREALRLMVLRHVIPARLNERDLMERSSIISLSRTEIPVSMENGSLRLAGARTVFEDVRGSNGVLHMINKVLP